MHYVLSRYLSTRIASIVCFILAVACKTWFLYLFMHFCADRGAMLLTTGNLLSGHGISIEQASLTDLSQRLYIHYNGWPPGYNLLLAPFMAILQKDHWVIAYLLVDLVTVTTLYWYTRRLLLFIQVPVWLVNLFLLFQAVLINMIMFYWEPTDLPALAALAATLFYCLKITQSKEFSPLHPVSLAIAAWVAASMRYQNIPIVIVLVGLLALIAVKNKTVYRRSAITAASVTAAGLLVLWLFQGWYFSSSFFLPEAEKGFFPEHLLYTSHFVVSSFIDVNFLALQLSNLTGIKYASWIMLAHIISAAGLVVVLIILGKQLWNRKIWGASPAAAFFLYGGLASLIIIVLLAWLSLTNGFVYLDPGAPWTYVMNERYFALPMLFIQISACWWLFVRKDQSNRLLKKILRVAVTGLFLFELTHGVYYLAKNISQPIISFHELVTRYSEPGKCMVQFIQRQQQEAPEVPVIVTAVKKEFCHTASLFGADAIYDPGVFNRGMPPTNKPVIVLAILHDGELPVYKKFLAQPGVRFLQKVNKHNFYTLYVTPAGATH